MNSAAEKKEAPRIFVTITTKNETHKLCLADLMAFCGLRESVTNITLSVERDEQVLKAIVEPGEIEYPNITVDAETQRFKRVCLGEFELPNNDYPTRLTARLYAGCAEYETDSPIAFVSHEVEDTAEYMAREDTRPMKKLIYVDYDVADTRTWNTSENIPEHREDEVKKNDV